jgi:hypothetical protein
MKKNTSKKVATKVAVVKSVKAPVCKQKATLVKPNIRYTENEVRGFLRLGQKSFIVPSKFTGIHVRDGKILGSDVIAHLERVSKTRGQGRRSRVKIGRRYASGTVTVVAR